MRNAELVQELREVALEAGAAIMEIYESDFDVRSKDDRSPVTDADERAENIIVPRLAKLTPDIRSSPKKASPRAISRMSAAGRSGW